MNEEWIKRVVEEFKETIIFETEYEEGMRCHYQDAVNWLRAILEKNQERLHQQLQKAREESRWQTIDELKFISDQLNELDFTRILYQYEMSRHRDHSELDQAPEKLPKAPESELDQDNLTN